MRIRTAGLVSILVVASSGICRAAMRAGVARVDITPPAGEQMWGYENLPSARHRHARSALRARACAGGRRRKRHHAAGTGNAGSGVASDRHRWPRCAPKPRGPAPSTVCWWPHPTRTARRW